MMTDIDTIKEYIYKHADDLGPDSITGAIDTLNRLRIRRSRREQIK